MKTVAHTADLLMTRVANGDRLALDRLYAELGQGIYGYLRRMGATPEDAADIVQEVFLRIWQQRQRYRGAQASAWIYRIARNARIDHARQLGVRTSLSIPDVMPETFESPEQSLAAEQLGARLQAALMTLPDATREAVLLSRFSPLSLDGIASVLETTPENVKVRLHRGLSALKACLEDEAND